MIDVAIVGAGRTGTALGYALSQKGYTIKALSCRSLASARESQRIIGEGKALADNIQTAGEGKLIFLCVQDDEIERVARELGASSLRWKNKYVFHCSGLFTSEILEPLRIKGALTASFHPVQSFSQKIRKREQFEGVYFGLEGNKEALELARKIIADLGGRSIFIDRKNKAVYHAACSMASNLFVVLLKTAAALLEHIGFDEELTCQILMPLVQGTLHNVKELDTESSLTGPIIRGDHASVEKHLEALKQFPSSHEIYVSLATQALEMAKRKKLPSEKIKALKQLLERK